MGLIKSALRNRLYIETLDALMTIGLIGPMIVNILDDEDTMLLAALDEWKADCMRNPNNARFGNKSAAKKKKPMRESRTLVAHQTEQCADNDEDGDAALDVLANEAEEMEEEDDDSDDEPVAEFTWAPFKHLEFQVCSEELDINSPLDAKDLKGRRVGFRLESGWDVGVFKKHYKGRSRSYQGTSQLYFNSFKKDYYAVLKISEYSAAKRWCFVERK
jgi:hypothetical protein